MTLSTSQWGLALSLPLLYCIIVASPAFAQEDQCRIVAEGSGFIPFEDTSSNGDPLGNGIDERTRFHLRFAAEDVAYLQELRDDALVSAAFVLGLQTSDKRVATDDVEIEGLQEIDLTDLPKESTLEIQLELLDHYSADQLLSRARQGEITMIYSDDARVISARLTLRFNTPCEERIEITAPTQDEHLFPGETYTITWTAPPSVDEVTLFFIGDDTSPEPPTEIIANYPADIRAFDWTVPDTLTRKARIRIEDAGDITHFDRSDRFKIKGYVLTRIYPDSTYERFTPGKHGWSFGNTQSNLFPPDWWRQDPFDYLNGADPFTGRGYPEAFTDPPISAAPPHFVDWPAFVRAFGTDEIYYISTEILSEFYRPSALTRWGTAIKSRQWGGSCSGMAIASLMAFGTLDLFNAAYPGVGAGDELYDLPISDQRRETINQLYAYWDGAIPQLWSQLTHTRTPVQTLEDLKAMMLSDDRNADSYLYINNLSGLPSRAHAVVPYRLEEAADGVWNVFVYDPNFPNDDSRQIVVNTLTNRWSYSPRYNGSGRFFLMDPMVGYLQPADLAPAAATAKSEPSPTLQQDVRIYPTPYATVRITGDAGEAGYTDSTAFNTFEGAYLDIAPSGYESAPDYVLPSGSYRIEMGRFSDAEATLSIFEGNLFYSYGRTDATNTQTDHVYYDGGLTLRNEDPETKVVDFRLVVAGGDPERVFEVERLALAPGDSLRVEVVSGEQLRLESLGGATRYDLVLHQVGSTGEQVFRQQGIPLSGDAAHDVAPRWEELTHEPVPIFIDQGRDGSVDDTLYVQRGVLGAPAQVAPVEGLAVSVPVTLVWQEDAEAISYEVQVSETTAFSELAVEETGLDEPNVQVSALRGARVYHWRVRSVGDEGPGLWSNARSFVTISGVSREDEAETLQTYVLEGAYPNPFNPQTTIRYALPASSDVRLAVYDLLGQEVALLVNRTQGPGHYAIVFDAGHLPSGVYFYRLEAGRFRNVRRMILLR